MDHLWAGWRSTYIEGTVAPEKPVGCVFCGIFASGEPDEDAGIVWQDEHVVAILNAFPYTSGHVLVMPRRHVAELGSVSGPERTVLWDTVHATVDAVTAAYSPGGVNVGANLGRAAGAGVPGHLHVHVLPRWDGDTNFMTSVANARVLPEPLSTSWTKLRGAWPAQG